MHRKIFQVSMLQLIKVYLVMVEPGHHCDPCPIDKSKPFTHVIYIFRSASTAFKYKTLIKHYHHLLLYHCYQHMCALNKFYRWVVTQNLYVTFLRSSGHNLPLPLFFLASMFFRYTIFDDVINTYATRVKKAFWANDTTTTLGLL